MPGNPGIATGRAGAETTPIGADAPLRLDAYSGAFLVARGYVDLFAVALDRGEAVGARRHVLRVAADGLVCGLPATAAMAVIAVGGLETEICHLSTIESARPALDGWISAIAEAAFGAAPAWPELLAAPGGEAGCAEGIRLYAGREVLWVRPLEGAFAVMDDAGDAVMTDSLSPPLAAGFCLRSLSPARYAAYPTAELTGVHIAAPLARFHRLAAEAIGRRLDDFDASARDRLAAREATNAAAVSQALTRLAQVGAAAAEDTEPVPESDPLLSAFLVVARRLDVAIPPLPPVARREVSLPQLARLTGFGFRRVLLREDWWRVENGPLIGQLAEAERPVALLPGGRARYFMIDGGRKIAVTPKIATGLAPEAVMLYPPLPETVKTLAGLTRLALRGGKRDLSTALHMSLLASVLGAVIPIATGFLFEWIVPRADLGQLGAVIAGLILATLGATGFELVKSFALVRWESRMEAGLQPAILQRLLSLPVGFFRDFGTGDLTDRVLAIQRIRHLIAGTTIVSLLSGGFAVVSFAIILLYSLPLALMAAGVVAIAAAVTAALGIGQLRHEREAVRLGGREDGLILQLIQGIGKLRVSASEPRLFGLWAQLFSRRRAALVKGQRYANLRATFYGSYPILAALMLFWVAGGILAGAPGSDGLSLGAFLAVSAAFGQLLAAMMAAGGAIAGTLGAVPLFERLRPIVTARPERREDKVDPGPLTGAIEIGRVSFRYAPDAPLVLDDVSLQVEPGQFVAIVGGSGSGKSTLQRLLLGFETAETGDILYQGQSIGGLDASALRRRIGVVLQSARVMSGSIFENITAGLPYSLDDAWEAARMAGIAEDIEAMPMGMHSLLMEGASTLSGGQLQRLMIARALVGKPQVLIFDEATSALDNVSQAIVTASLARMQATRIVIAHRLTTIRDADRIFVLDRGRILESGGFESLMAQGGAFAALARRQLL